MPSLCLVKRFNVVGVAKVGGMKQLAHVAADIKFVVVVGVKAGCKQSSAAANTARLPLCRYLCIT